MTAKEKLKQLILSENAETAETGLIINAKFNFFPNTARLYRKYKKTNFWDMAKRGGIYSDIHRYCSLYAVFCQELKSEFCQNWFMILTDHHAAPFYKYQNCITEDKFRYIRKKELLYLKQERQYFDYPKEHPATNIFKFPPKPIKVVRCLGPDMNLNIIETE